MTGSANSPKIYALENPKPLRRKVRAHLHRVRPRLEEAAARALDMVLAIALLTFLAPLILVRGMLGWAATGRLLARVQRIGVDGKQMELWRFAGDIPGRGLATPFNLIRGELSLAGPRPETVQEAVSSIPDPVRRSVSPGVFSPYEVRRNIGLDWEAEGEIERDFVYAQRPLSGVAVAARTLVGRVLGGQSDRPCPDNVVFFDISIRNTTMDESLDWIMTRVKTQDSSMLAFVNPDCLNSAWENENYREVLQGAARVLPDGIGVHLGCRIQGTRLAANLNGTDMFPRLCKRAAENGASLFLLGARPGIAAAAAENMEKQIPGLRIAGTHHGYFDEQKTAEVIAKVNGSGADILLVAMGAPRQELWLARHADELTAYVRMGVGGLFDFYSGRVQRAPVWVREIGMEWVWRILMEPRRMWRRYVIGNPVFLSRVWRESRGQRRQGSSPVGSSQRLQAARRGMASLKRISWRAALAAGATCKRGLDLAGAAAGLLLLSPVFAIVMATIRLESPGPVLFRQQRIGLGGRPFMMLKFRSMYIDAEARRDAMMEKNEMQGGVLFKIKEDPRVTRVGRFIRKASIDELPQLWNVFRGDMSLVGPRPPLPSEVADYGLADRRRLHVKPGITCIWQVSGRSDIPFERQVELDLDYIYSQSLKTDIKLLLRTVPAVILGRGAY